MADLGSALAVSQISTSIGLVWTGTGWSQVMANPYFGTTYIFYRSPLTGVAGPTDGIAADLTSLGINYRVIDQVPSGAVDRTAAFQFEITTSDAVTRQNTGKIVNY